MRRPSRTKRVATVMMLVLAAAGGACGSSGDEAGGASVDTSEATAPASAGPEAATPTTAAVPVDDEVIAFQANVAPLVPGETYVTNTDVPFRFSVAESETNWRGVVSDNWSVSMVFGDPDETGDIEGPQLSLGVAEPGATVESVVAVMTESGSRYDYQPSEGLFGGRNATILDGRFDDPGVSPFEVFTGEVSSIEVISMTGNAYRSHIFEEGGRVFIVSVEAPADDMAVVLAEAAPVFESLRIGAAE